MELLIRSQNKEILIKIDNLQIDNDIFDNEDDFIIYGGKKYEKIAYILGKYKSKERALEVLDEIQEAKLGNYHYRFPSNVKVSNKEDTIVYEMPQE